MPEIKPIRVFTRDDPCSKVHIHNCFIGPDNQYQRRAVVEARGEIGANAPKYMLREGYLVYRGDRGIDYYELTPEGKRWLSEGLVKFLKLRPDKVADVKQCPALK